MSNRESSKEVIFAIYWKTVTLQLLPPLLPLWQ